MAVMEDDENRANVEGNGYALTRTEDLEAMPSSFQSVLAQRLLMGELSKRMPYMVCPELAQDLEVPDYVSMDELFRSDEFKRVKDERDHLLKDVAAYKMEKDLKQLC